MISKSASILTGGGLAAIALSASLAAGRAPEGGSPAQAADPLTGGGLPRRLRTATGWGSSTGRGPTLRSRASKPRPRVRLQWRRSARGNHQRVVPRARARHKPRPPLSPGGKAHRAPDATRGLHRRASPPRRPAPTVHRRLAAPQSRLLLGSPHQPASHRAVRRVHPAPGWNRPGEEIRTRPIVSPAPAERK